MVSRTINAELGANFGHYALKHLVLNIVKVAFLHFFRLRNANTFLVFSLKVFIAV